MFVMQVADPFDGSLFGVRCLVGLLWAGGFLGLLVAGRLMARRMVASCFGDPIMDISVAEVHPGDAFDLTYFRPVTGEVAVKEIVFSFIQRKTTIGRGPDPTTQVHDAQLEETVLAGGLMTPGQVIQRRARFRAPCDAKPTAIAAYQRLQYFVELKIDLSNWPDVNEIYEIPVTLPDSN